MNNNMIMEGTGVVYLFEGISKSVTEYSSLLRNILKLVSSKMNNISLLKIYYE